MRAKAPTHVPSFNFTAKAVSALALLALGTSILLAPQAANATNPPASRVVACSAGGNFTIANEIVTGNNNCAGNVVIPDDVTAINPIAFAYNSNIVTVTIGSGVTDIGHDAFAYNSALTTVTLGQNVVSIQAQAFWQNVHLATVNFNHQLVFIGDGAFKHDPAITHVALQDHVTTITQNAFEFDTGLTTVTFGSRLQTIGDNAFDQDHAITSLVIPNNVTSIGAGAFDTDTNLISLTIGTGVTSLGAYAFNATTLTSYDYCGPTLLSTDFAAAMLNPANIVCTAPPVTPSDMLENAAAKSAASALVANDYTAGSWTTLQTALTATYTSADSQVSIDNQTTAIGQAIVALAPRVEGQHFCNDDATGASGTYEVLNGVATSDPNCFGSLTFPIGLTGIADGGFASLSITSLTLPGTLTNIGVGAFADVRLAALSFPSSVTSIGQSAFSGDDVLTSLTIPTGITTLGTGAFSGATALTSYTYCGNTLTYTTLRAAGLAHKLNVCPGAPSDTTDYDAAVSQVGALTSSDFTTVSWSNLQATLSPALNNTASQATIDAATSSIVAARTALVHVADLTAYNAAVAAVAALTSTNYTTNSWNALQATLSPVPTSQSLQAVVDAATTSIVAARTALVPVADLTVYNAVVAAAAALTSTDYTAGSWNALQATLSPVPTNQSLQSVVDAAIQAINDALSRLAANPVTPNNSSSPIQPGLSLQNALSVNPANSVIHVNESTKLNVTGGSGSGSVIFINNSSSNCSVDALGVVTAKTVGVCRIFAIKFGSVDYFSTSSLPAAINIIESEPLKVDTTAADKAAADKAAADKAAADKAAADKAAADKAAADKAAADKAAADKAAADKAAADNAAADNAAADKAAADKAVAAKSDAPIALSVENGALGQKIIVSLSLTSKYASQRAKIQLLTKTLIKGKVSWSAQNLGSAQLDTSGKGKFVATLGGKNSAKVKPGMQIKVTIGSKALAWLTISSR